MRAQLKKSAVLICTNGLWSQAMGISNYSTNLNGLCMVDPRLLGLVGVYCTWALHGRSRLLVGVYCTWALHGRSQAIAVLGLCMVDPRLLGLVGVYCTWALHGRSPAIGISGGLLYLDSICMVDPRLLGLVGVYCTWALHGRSPGYWRVYCGSTGFRSLRGPLCSVSGASRAGPVGQGINLF